MEWVVTSGATIEEATEMALDELGIAIEDAEVVVLQEPKQGLFGIHSRQARVQARVAPAAVRPKTERRDRKRGGSKRSSKDATAKKTGQDAASAPDDSDGGNETRAARKPARKRSSGKKASAEKSGANKSEGDMSGADTSEEGRAEESKAEERKADGGSGDGKTRGRRKKKDGPPDAEPNPSDSRNDDQSNQEAPQGEAMTSVSIEDQVEVIEDFLDGLMDAFDLDGEIDTVEIEPEISEVRITGDELGYMIGPKGQTLSAIHELCRTVAQRRLPGPHDGRIRLDIGGYRERRREALQRFATQIAEDVRSSGVEKALEPMSPPDRKIVHDTINEIDGVTTSSEGEEPRRRVVVSPAD